MAQGSGSSSHALQNRATTLPTDIDLETLGRQRPTTFPTLYSEIGFCVSLFGSMVMAEYFISGFNLVLPQISASLNITPESRTWPASAFTLVTGAFLLPSARLADIYGAYTVFNLGLGWFSVWSLVAGFSQNYLMLIFCRALQGLGASAFLPSGIMLLGSIYRPGPRKNIVFSLYGALAPVGFFMGIFVGGLTANFLSWKWYFWLGGILCFVFSATSLLAIPRDGTETRDSGMKMDWLGTLTIVPGLLLIVYAITDCSHAGRASPQIYVAFALGVVCLGIAAYVEGWVAKNPLLPFVIFRSQSMKPLVVSLFFTYGVFGLYLFYASFYIEIVLNIDPLQTAVWFAPMAVGGLILATVSGVLLHRLPGRALLVLSGLGNLACTMLFALMPKQPDYWAFILPAMIGATVGVDITYVVSNVFITTHMPRHQQGVAGALINSLVFLGTSFFLGIADLVSANTAHLGLRASYKAAFWLGAGCAGIALACVIFTKIGSAKSELTDEERAELEMAEQSCTPSWVA
ncbi:major facilitator superfamily domain-containing protein [Diplogelasinospora grovesii]|uniref:Major facilitator superfamily domain-containing protein n=1 Tax=Diplogelasinospora grovesii TaxID=303347 RepID=A0AAN6NAV9_9PEZI|nr:major facilitator superfamily domain-containing protein [Diplogelasinospora grovesii]